MTNLGQKILYGANAVFELSRGVIVLLVIGSLVHFFVVTIFIVDGISMLPNFQDKEILLVNRLSYLASSPKRGEAVILKFPGDPERKKYIKRIIGLPDEKIEIKDNKVYANGKKLNETYLPAKTITLPNMSVILGYDQYFFMGDNRENSSDSRIWGGAAREFIIGRADFILWPLSKIGLLEQPVF